MDLRNVNQLIKKGNEISEQLHSWNKSLKEIQEERYIEMLVITNEELRELCIEKRWFTCGSNSHYAKLFYANENFYSLEEIITIIWVCSNDEFNKSEIKNVFINKGYCKLEVIS